MAGVVVVFAKAPLPGTVKTRMTPPLTPVEAARLYACMLDDVLEHTARLARAFDLEPVVAVHPASRVGEVARRAPRWFRAVPQWGRDLGARMEAAARLAAAGGFSPILMRGSDSPALDADHLEAALGALREGADLALCPDLDGGYNLVALREPVRGLFAHPMSTRTVLEDTLERGREAGLRAEVLRPGFDLDTATDLRWLAEARRRRGGLPCPRTLSYLDSEDLWRHLVPRV